MRYVFKLLFRADDDAKGSRSSISRAAKREQNRHAHSAEHQDMQCGIRRCSEKNYENGAIVFYATSSFRICLFHIFARKIVHIRMWTKSITLNKERLDLCCLSIFVF